MDATHEYHFSCPYCGDHVSCVLETFGEHTSQQYIEDCETCCRPIQLSYASEDFEITAFSADTTDG